MIEMRFHGRGGQGTVKGCQTMVKALVDDGKYAQFIPAFGVERKGSPVYGYFRLDDKEIRYNCQVYNPDVVVVSDSSLMESIDIFEGARSNAKVIINSPRNPDEIVAPAHIVTAVVNATDIALKTIGVDIPNTVMLGAIARILDEVNAETLRKQVLAEFGEKNAEAFDIGYEQVKLQKSEVQ